MVLLTATKKLNQWLGPFLLRQGVKARFALDRGVLRDNPSLDAALGLLLAQKLISLEVYETSQQAVKQAQKNSNVDADKKSEIRIRVLEDYVRPALLRNNQWSDLRQWQFHQRLMKWLRKEFLEAKHEPALKQAVRAFPSLQKSPQLDSSPFSRQQGAAARLLSGKLPFDDDDDMKSDNLLKKLPKSSLIAKALGMTSWNISKDLPATGKHMKEIVHKLGGQVIELRGGAVRFAHVPNDDADLSSLSLEEILEVVGGHVAQCGPFNALCEQADIFQLWTREYVEQLGHYLLKRASSFDGETIILDVGAGDGLLAQLLRDYFDEQRKSSTVKEPSMNRARRVKRFQKKKTAMQPSRSTAPLDIPRVIATDNGSWRISQKAEVERLSVEESIELYGINFENGERQGKQVIVLCSWMPMNEDWTNIFRNKVDEYILIGECDDGQCGDNWETWGNHSYLDDDLDENLFSANKKPKETPVETKHRPPIPYKVDGYVRYNLDELSPYQFSRFDCRSSKQGQTVSFRCSNRFENNRN